MAPWAGPAQGNAQAERCIRSLRANKARPRCRRRSCMRACRASRASLHVAGPRGTPCPSGPTRDRMASGQRLTVDAAAAPAADAHTPPLSPVLGIRLNRHSRGPSRLRTAFLAPLPELARGWEEFRHQGDRRWRAAVTAAGGGGDGDPNRDALSQASPGIAERSRSSLSWIAACCGSARLWRRCIVSAAPPSPRMRTSAWPPVPALRPARATHTRASPRVPRAAELGQGLLEKSQATEEVCVELRATLEQRESRIYNLEQVLRARPARLPARPARADHARSPPACLRSNCRCTARTSRS
jgi:hypothetical protein